MSAEDTLRQRIISTLENGPGNTKNFEWMKTHLLTDLELQPSDLRNLLKIMWNDGTVGQTYGNYWIKVKQGGSQSHSPESTMNASFATQFPHNNVDVVQNDMCLRMQKDPAIRAFVKEEFSEVDAYMFIGLACVVLDKLLPFELHPRYTDRSEEVFAKYAEKLGAFIHTDIRADPNE